MVDPLRLDSRDGNPLKRRTRSSLPAASRPGPVVNSPASIFVGSVPDQIHLPLNVSVAQLQVRLDQQWAGGGCRFRLGRLLGCILRQAVDSTNENEARGGQYSVGETHVKDQLRLDWEINVPRGVSKVRALQLVPEVDRAGAGAGEWLANEES